jgi:hypothetical protein
VNGEDVDDFTIVRLTGALGRALAGLRAMRPKAGDQRDGASDLAAHLAAIVEKRKAVETPMIGPNSAPGS